ncbi:MAG TPA: sigma-70 family RNA polymerase sigma factor [Bryobacteraceae bacterium]|jgi:RNA polymerase sigma-70 factor (ECF subfamily)|nr:sigma-70 family RNA polymerase sigma factor [Bryobacteraceae bacterium]
MSLSSLSEPKPPVPIDPGWGQVVDRIRRGDPTGMEDLYRVFSKGVRFFLYRQLGPHDLDDKVHDVFLIVTQSIRNGDLREPDRLMGYVRTVVRRQVAAHIEGAVQARRNQTDIEGGVVLSARGPDPERRAIEHQNEQLAMRVLNSIAKRDREVLIRFYLQEQTPDEICQAMELTETQFRLIKSRAKARFGELGKRRFSMRSGYRRM